MSFERKSTVHTGGAGSPSSDPARHVAAAADNRSDQDGSGRRPVLKHRGRLRRAAKKAITWLTSHPFPVVVGGLVLTTVTAIGIFIVRPYLEISPQDKAGVPALAAAIALIGTLATATVAAIGHILRQSIDERTARLAEAANKRAEVDQQRLHILAATETVRLLSTADGKAAPRVQVSAALIALGKLGEIALALDLAHEMWPKDQITSSTAVSLCDVGILSDDPENQRSAAMLIFNNWERLNGLESQGYLPPSLLDGSWPAGITSRAKQIIADALTDWLAETKATSDDDARIRLIEAAGLSQPKPLPSA